MVAIPVHSCLECYPYFFSGYHKPCIGAGCDGCNWTGACPNFLAAFIKANGGVNPMTGREYGESELEGLQCTPFHAPDAVGKWDVRARNLCLQDRLQQLTGVSWDVSCQYNDWAMSFLCMTPAVTLDNLSCTRFVKRSHECPPEQWTRPEVEEAGRLVALSYKWDMARDKEG